MSKLIHYDEKIENYTFDEKFKASNYINCTFINCRFKEVDNMNVQILELFNSGNKLIGCWYNPILIFDKLIESLNEDVNLIDLINKAFIRNNRDKHTKKQKQLILIDV